MQSITTILLMRQNFWEMVFQKYALEHLLFPSNDSNDSKKKKEVFSIRRMKGLADFH